jgi:phage terminase small subunit
LARAVVAGKSGRVAYRAAGYQAKDRAADANASRLLTDAKVAARVEELKKAAADATVMDLNEVLAELSKLGRASIQDVIVAGDNTADVIADLRDMKPEHAAAIQELTVETYLEGGGEDAREVKRVRIKLHDKRGALAELRRHHEPDRHEHSGKDGKPIETRDVSEKPGELEIARRIMFLLERAARAAPAAPVKPKAKG